MKKVWKRLWLLGLIGILLLTGCVGDGTSSQESSSGAGSQVSTDGKNETGSEEKSDTSEDTPQGTLVTVFLMNDEADGFTVKDVTLEELDAQKLIDEFIAAGEVKEGTKVNSFSKDDAGVLSLDLSAEFQTKISESGETGQYYIIGGIVNTFLGAYGADSIRITCNGADLETEGSTSGNMGYFTE